MWSEVWSLLRQIPATFWGVVAGSAFTLIGVRETNRGNDRRLAAQLAHDRDLKAKGREQQLRKEIYVAAADAIQSGLSALWRMTNLDLPHDKVSEQYSERAGAIAKVHVVASVETARAFAAFIGAFGGAMSRLALLRLPLAQTKTEIEIFQGLIDSAQKESVRWVEEMKQYNLAGKNDARLWDQIQRNFQFAQQQVQDFLAKQAEHRAAFGTGILRLLEAAAQEMGAVQVHFGPLISAVRDELGLSIDRVAYAAILEDLYATERERLAEFLKGLAALVAANQTKLKPPSEAV